MVDQVLACRLDVTGAPGQLILARLGSPGQRHDCRIAVAFEEVMPAARQRRRGSGTPNGSIRLFKPGW
jgi:hypothetical protein